jgi:hypothetical protein
VSARREPHARMQAEYSLRVTVWLAPFCRTLLHRILRSMRVARKRESIAYANALVLALSAGTSAQAQLNAARVQLALPPSTWRITVSGDLLPPRRVEQQAGGPAIAMTTAAARGTVRLGVPVWKRGLYRTVVANEFSFDNIALEYARIGPTPNTGDIPRGPSGLAALHHDLLVSQAIGNRA